MEDPATRVDPTDVDQRPVLIELLRQKRPIAIPLSCSRHSSLGTLTTGNGDKSLVGFR